MPRDSRLPVEPVPVQLRALPEPIGEEASAMIDLCRAAFATRYLNLCGLACALCSLVCSAAFAGEYLCTPEKANGFNYNPATKDWDYMRYTTNMYYTISPVKYGKHVY